MKPNYNKLWKLLIDKKINKTQLCELANISTNAMAKLGRNEFVSMESLYKICLTLNCNIGDIVDIIPEGACLQNDLDNPTNERS